MRKYISFPKNEYASYLNRLKDNKVIYTTRVSNEANKYKFGEIYNSDFGVLKVISLKHFSKLIDHPFYHELNNNQLQEIEKYIDEFGYDVIGLIKIE